MTKKLSPLLLIIFSFFVTSAQSLKTYNGAFETRNLIGNAAYQYFENDQGGRTFDGSFKFSKTNNSVNIDGQFKNNLKSGLWKFKFTNYLSSDLMLKYDINSTSIGSYLDGKLNGKWNLQRTMTLSASNNTVSQYYKSELNSFAELFGGKKIDLSKKQTVLENAAANFSNNHFVGDFIYSLNNGQTKVKGQFDDEGLMEGSWLVTYTKNGIPIEQKYMYLKGILFTIITKDVSTGETSSNFDLEPRVKDFLKNLDVNNNTSFTRNQYYTLETLKPNRNGDLIDQALSIWIDNKSIENSAYNFEVKQGTIDIDNFPQKIMAENRERNEQKEKDDQERKEALEMKSGSQITGLRSGITVTKGVRPLNLGALKFEDDFSENAKIYLVVKFNANGIYESSDTANGTTTFNATTIDIAKRKAAEFKFPLTANGGFSTILFNFKMQ